MSFNAFQQCYKIYFCPSYKVLSLLEGGKNVIVKLRDLICMLTSTVYSKMSMDLTYLKPMHNIHMQCVKCTLIHNFMRNIITAETN